jgi:hypothetical protein
MTMTNPTTTGQPGWETTQAWRDLLDGLRQLDATFLDGPNAVVGEQAVAEGYRFLATVFAVACDIFLFSDPARPRFIDINTPFRPDRAWGGDNTDAYYAFAPLDPRRGYRVSGNRGDSVYFSLTVYNEPEPGQWSNRVVGVVNDSDLTFDADGNFSFAVGPARPEGHDGPFIELTQDAAAAVTRDYQIDPQHGRRIEWTIEADEPADTYRYDDHSTAAALRTVLRWIQEMLAIVPLPVVARTDEKTLGHNSPSGANTFAAPYQVPDANYGWSARDACYSFGQFDLGPDQALVVTHRPPACRFWNFTLWNQFMAGYNNDYAPTSINLGTAAPNADGTVTVVVAHTRLDHPNALSTIGHERGLLTFRWFHAAEVPEPPVVEVVALGDAPSSVT